MDLEAYREKRGWNYSELARELPLTDPTTARRIARGERWPGPETLQAIIEATGGEVTIEAMLGRWRERQTPVAAE